MTQPLSDTIILVADDQPDVVRTLCQPLHKAGASLRYVSDAYAALAALATHPTDLILADMKMPPEEWVACGCCVSCGKAAGRSL